MADGVRRARGADDHTATMMQSGEHGRRAGDQAEEEVRRLLDSHGGFARDLVAREMRRRNGRHRSITPSEFGHDMVLEAAGLDFAGRPRAAGDPLPADDPRVRDRISRRIRWRLDARERLSRVRARRHAVDVHEAWDAIDPRTMDPGDHAASREQADRAAWIAAHRRTHERANPDPDPTSSSAPTQRGTVALVHDEAGPDATARLHGFAQTDGRTDPKAARRLALHLLVEVMGIPVSVARSAVRVTRSTAYRELDAMKRMMHGPPSA